MNRYMQIPEKSFDLYTPPLAAIEKALSMAQKRYVDNQEMANKLLTLNIDALPQDQARARAITQKYQQNLDKIVQDTGGAYERIGPQLYNLQREVIKDFGPAGEASAIQQNFSAYQGYVKDEQERLKKGEILANDLGLFKKASLSRFGGTKLDPDTGSYSQFNPIFTPKHVPMDFGKVVSQVPDVKFEWEKQIPSKDGMTWVKEKHVGFGKSADRLYGALQNELLSDPERLSYYQSISQVTGIPLEQYLSGVAQSMQDYAGASANYREDVSLEMGEFDNWFKMGKLAIDRAELNRKIRKDQEDKKDNEGNFTATPYNRGPVSSGSGYTGKVKLGDVNIKSGSTFTSTAALGLAGGFGTLNFGPRKIKDLIKSTEDVDKYEKELSAAGIYPEVLKHYIGLPQHGSIGAAFDAYDAEYADKPAMNFNTLRLSPMNQDAFAQSFNGLVDLQGGARVYENKGDSGRMTVVSPGGNSDEDKWARDALSMIKQNPDKVRPSEIVPARGKDPVSLMYSIDVEGDTRNLIVPIRDENVINNFKGMAELNDVTNSNRPSRTELGVPFIPNQQLIQTYPELNGQAGLLKVDRYLSPGETKLKTAVYMELPGLNGKRIELPNYDERAVNQYIYQMSEGIAPRGVRRAVPNNSTVE